MFKRLFARRLTSARYYADDKIDKATLRVEELFGQGRITEDQAVELLDGMANAADEFVNLYTQEHVYGKKGKGGNN